MRVLITVIVYLLCLILHICNTSCASFLVRGCEDSKYRFEVGFVLSVAKYLYFHTALAPSTLICHHLLQSPSLWPKNYIKSKKRGQICIEHRWKPIFPYPTRPIYSYLSPLPLFVAKNCVETKKRNQICIRHRWKPIFPYPHSYICTFLNNFLIFAKDCPEPEFQSRFYYLTQPVGFFLLRCNLFSPFFANFSSFFLSFFLLFSKILNLWIP